MKILIDMNLSPEWVSIFAEHAWIARHWSEIGDPGATDDVIMAWGRTHGYIVFTHDLDFGAMLAATQAKSPSVIQVRTQNVGPEYLEAIVVNALYQYQTQLLQGALIIIDEHKLRARILPLLRDNENRQ